MASGISDYLANKLIDSIFRNISFTPSTTLYVALCSVPALESDTGTGIAAGSNYSPVPVGVETAGISYTRIAYNPSSSSNWEATQGGTSGPSAGTTALTQNSTSIIYGPAGSGGWGTVTGVAICDADVTILTGKTFTHLSATVNLASTTGLKQGDYVFLDDGIGGFLTSYIVTLVTNDHIVLNDVWPNSTTSTGTLTDGGNLLYWGDLTTPRTVASSDIFDFASESLQIQLTC